MNNDLRELVLDTPVGNLLIVGSENEIFKITFTDERRAKTNESAESSKAIKEAVIQLTEYFKGMRKLFSLPLEIRGTPFQKKVWEATQSVPFGEVKTYSDIAEYIGNPNAYRAVANALGKNNFVIVVPCHRIVSKNGMGGFSSGLWRKEWLLKHEGSDHFLK